MRPFKFLHTADLHLGYVQYKNDERYKDFFRAFKWILDKAMKEEVDFVLLAGDMFNSKNINPKIMKDAFLYLQNFKNSCMKKLGNPIPIIAIEGNHDRPVWGSNNQSWMSFLTDLDLIYVLSAKYDEKEKKFPFLEFSPTLKKGGMIQIKDTRIYGLQYLGAITPKMIPIITNSIESNNDTFNILMLHYGISGQDKKKTGMDLNDQILSLHDKVDYLALGHYHKMYTLPLNDPWPWIFNPGSSEINSISELENIHGVWLFDIHGKEQKNNWNIKFIECVNGDTDDSDSMPNRSFFSILPIDIGRKELTNFNKTIDFIINKIKRSGLNFESITSDSDKSNLNIPILVLSLKGEISYSRMEINERKLKDKIHEIYEILDIRLLTNQLISKLDVIEIEDNNNSIELIEKTVFSKMMEENEELNKQNKDLFKFLIEYKSQLLGTKINYKDLSDHISQWWDEYFGEKIEDLELIDPELETNAEAAENPEEEEEKKTVEKQIFDDIEFEEDPTEVYDDGSAYLNDEKEEK